MPLLISEISASIVIEADQRISVGAASSSHDADADSDPESESECVQDCEKESDHDASQLDDEELGGQSASQETETGARAHGGMEMQTRFMQFDDL